MSIERRIYGEGEWARTVVISHGASENVVISDTDWPKEHDGWGNPIKKPKGFKPDPYEEAEHIT